VTGDLRDRCPGHDNGEPIQGRCPWGCESPVTGDLRDRIAETVTLHHGAYVSKWGDGPGYNWKCPCGAMAGEPYPRTVTPRLERDEASRQMHAHLADALLPLFAEVETNARAEVRERVEAVLSSRWYGASLAKDRANLRAALGGDQ
jgi:hypothetical protein